MAIFKFLDTSELETFATSLASDLARRFPPASESRTDAGAKHQWIAVVAHEFFGARVVISGERECLGEACRANDDGSEGDPNATK